MKSIQWIVLMSVLLVPPAVLSQNAPAETSRRNEAIAAYNKGAQLAKQGRYKEAIELLNEYLSFDPTDGDTYAHLAYAYIKLGDNVAALETAKKAVKFK